MADETNDKGSRSLRSLAVLEATVAHGGVASTGEVMSASGLPKATVHRICALLEREGYLRRDSVGRGLVTGFRLDRLALGILSGPGHRRLTHAILESLAAEVRETCNLNVPDGGHMLYVDRVEAEWPLRLQLPVGTRVPLHCTASGKLYLSMLSSVELRTMLKTLKLERHTANTCTTIEELEKRLAVIRAEGIGTDDEEFLDGMTAAAVPVLDDHGRLNAVLAVHAPSIRMSLADARSHVPALRRAARQLAIAMGIAREAAQ